MYSMCLCFKANNSRTVPCLQSCDLTFQSLQRFDGDLFLRQAASGPWTLGDGRQPIGFIDRYRRIADAPPLTTALCQKCCCVDWARWMVGACCSSWIHPLGRCASPMMARLSHLKALWSICPRESAERSLTSRLLLFSAAFDLILIASAAVGPLGNLRWHSSGTSSLDVHARFSVWFKSMWRCSLSRPSAATLHQGRRGLLSVPMLMIQ